MPYLGQRPSKGDENNFKILDDISSYTLTFDGSDSSVVSAANDTITSLTHRFVQGQRVTYNNGGGSNIAGLTSGTVYYVIKHDHHNIKLATSASNAANGTAVNITNVGGGASHTINVAFDGVNTKFKATHTNGQKAKITRSAQLVISINGVIQQPHDSATPSTGFGFDLDGTIVFSQAPVSTDVFWAHVLTNNNVTFDISNNDIDNFTGDGSTTEFNLSKSPPDNRNILVTIDGVVQYPNDPDGTARAYVVVENVLTFNSAPPSGVEIQVRHIGFAGSTSGSGGVTNFYGRTGSVVLKDTDNITVNDANITGNLTVDGDFTTLNTTLREVELLHVDANSSTTAGIITQRGSGDILNLFDNNSEVLTVTDGGQIGINSTSPSIGALVDIGIPATKTGGLDATVSIASTDNKTYPTSSSFSVTLGLKQEMEVGGTQTINATTPGGFNFIAGITNFMRRKNNNVQDQERAYYAGINQNFSWNDENTLKQYVGISDSVTYFGNDANGRTTSFLGAKTIVCNPGAGKTQTINIARGEDLSFRNFDAGTTKTVNISNWQGFNPNFSFLTIGGAVQGTTTNAAFYDTASSWGFNGNGSINYTVTNLYGLRLRPPTSSTGLTVTNNYGVSQEWSSAKNYFAGKVGVGVNDPEAYQSSSNNLVVGNTGDAAGITIRSGTNNGGYITFANAGSGSGLYKSRIAYDHQGDKLTFSTNGTNRLFIKGGSATDGRVGINTLTPNAPLDVFHNGSATYKDMIMARSHSGGFAIQCSDIDASNPTWALRTYASENMIISPGGSGVNNHKVFIRGSDGHIGINTTIPNKLVTIKAISPVVRIEAADSSDKRLDFMVSNVGIATISAEQSNQQLSFKTTSGEVRINTTGAVGVGTANPQVKLDVREGSILVDAFNTSGDHGLFFRRGFITGSNPYNVSILAVDHSGANKDGLSINAYDGISFCTGSNTRNEQLRISTHGDVSIGSTANALRRLDVVGNSLLVRPTIDNVSSFGNGSTVNNSIIIRMPYGENPGSTNHGGARFGIQFTGANNTTDVPSLNWGDDPTKSASIYAVSEDNLGYNRKVGLAFYTSEFDAVQEERIRIANDGKLLVGVHTTSDYTWQPRARFATESSGDASSVHFGSRVGGGVDPAIMMLRRGGSTAWHHHVGRIYTDHYPSIYFQTSFAAAPGAENFKTGMVIKHNVGVGIGSDAPAERLVVQGNGISNLAYDHDGGGFTSNSGGALVLTGYYDYSGAKLGLMVDNAGQGRIMTKTNQSLLIGTNNSKVITINGSGSVGIRTDVLGQIFTVKGATDIMHYPNSTIQNDRLQLGFNAPEGYIKAKNSSGSPAANIALYTTDTSGNTNKIMHLSHDGKVGIGTNLPSTKLHVIDYSSDPYLRIGGGGRDCGIQLDANANFVAFRTDGANRLWINAHSDGIYFTTGGSSASNTRLKIDTSGHLTLQGGKIYGDDNASNVLDIRSTSGNVNHSRIEIGASQSSDNGGIHFYTAGSSTATRRMTLKGTSGNLGLAVDNPDTKLHIVHETAAEDVVKIEAKPVTATTGAKSKLIFQITQSNNQSARLAEIHSLAENNWGGGMAFNYKPRNSTPNNTTEEVFRYNHSGNAATNARIVFDAYLQMGGYNNTNESFVNLAVLFSARDMAGSSLVSGQTDTISGYARRRTTSDGSGTFFFGPYGAFPCGDYTALFRMKVADRSGSSVVGYIDIIGNGLETQGRNIAPQTSARRLDIQTNDFTESNKYQYFALDFSKANSAAHIETRFLNYSSATTDIYFDHVLILPRINHGFEGGSGVFDY